VVTQLNVSKDGQSGTAVKGAAASYLNQFGNRFLDGSFVASEKAVPGYPNMPTITAHNAGLKFQTSGKGLGQPLGARSGD
jgi:hypothetical protein